MRNKAMPTGQTNLLGSMVTVDCGMLGAYQGQLIKFDSDMNTLTLKHAFHNGLRCEQMEVNLRLVIVQSLKHKKCCLNKMSGSYILNELLKNPNVIFLPLL